MSLFQKLNSEGYLRDLEVQKEVILEELGLGEIDPETLDFEYVDFSSTDIGSYYRLAVLSIRYQEYVSGILALTLQRRKNAEAKLESILNKSIANSALKPTEAKAAAKGSDEYMKVARALSAIEAWEDYLHRLTKTLDQTHYLAKNKMDELKNQYHKGHV